MISILCSEWGQFVPVPAGLNPVQRHVLDGPSPARSDVPDAGSVKGSPGA